MKLEFELEEETRTHVTSVNIQASVNRNLTDKKQFSEAGNTNYKFSWPARQ